MDGKSQRRTTTSHAIPGSIKMLAPFIFAKTPHLVFGSGKIDGLIPVLELYGNRVVLVTGATSFQKQLFANDLLAKLGSHNLSVARVVIDREPTPDMVDAAVRQLVQYDPQVVVAIGGGSVLDAGKAISAMLSLRDSVREYLEGIGTKVHPGTKVPFIAVPTTSGTGSEATKNAVLSEIGSQGFKRSLRHNNFVPDVAIVDPSLTISCPAFTTAASGMDAFTQLLESFLSTMANPLTDSLSLEGLRRVSRSLLNTYQHPEALQAREDMSLAAYLSGVTLANAGLGTVHGFASSIGSKFEIPHGVVCSVMMYPVNLLTARKLVAEKNEVVLRKYIQAASLFVSGEAPVLVDKFLEYILFLKNEMKVPGLSAYGVTQRDLAQLASATDNKYNPVALSRDEMEEALTLAL